MTAKARFAHINLIARDWKRLARFYERVFGCSQVPPERRLSGRWLEQATGLPGAELQGIHLRLPGQGDKGPTLEIFQYAQALEGLPPAVNRPGFGHIAFAVEDVAATRQEVLEAGGSELGAITTTTVPGAGKISFVYLTDPEGNILELQRWECNPGRSNAQSTSASAR